MKKEIIIERKVLDISSGTLDEIISYLEHIKQDYAAKGFDCLQVESELKDDGYYQVIDHEYILIASRPETDDEYGKRVATLKKIEADKKAAKKKQREESKAKEYSLYLSLKEKFEK